MNADHFKDATARAIICSARDALSQARSASEGLFPRWRFGLVSTLPALSVVFALAMLGCSDAPPGPAAGPVSPCEDLGSHFDPAQCGTIRGQILWKGDLPKVADFEIAPNLLGGEAVQKRQIRPNPNAPTINSRSKSISGAVVFLRGVDLPASKPWNLPPVTVEQRDCQFQILQGGGSARVGFVRRGDRIRMLSRDRFLYTLHAGGVEFLSLSFPDPDQPLERSLARKGIVELSSGTGYFWMRAYLHVDDHPYYARSDEHGQFELTDVPPGRYEVVCWLPNWLKERHERDPESGLICRLYYKQPVEQVQSLSISSKAAKEVRFAISAEESVPTPAGLPGR